LGLEAALAWELAFERVLPALLRCPDESALSLSLSMSLLAVLLCLLLLTLPACRLPTCC
jgi:hypothetical protein